MKLMSKTEEAGMVDIINAVMDKVHGGADPTDTIIIMADQRGLAPEAAARVCEACNKIMSIDKLSSTDKDARCGQYPLADAGAVMKRLEPSTAQEAEVIAIKKTASEGIPEYATEVPVVERTRAERAYLNRHAILEEHTRCVHAFKTATEDYFREDNKARQEEIGAEEDYKSLVDLARNINNKDALDLARYVESTYGSMGKDLIQMLSGSLDRPLPEPINKEASAFVPPDTKLYRTVDSFMERGYARLEALTRRDAAVKKAEDVVGGALKDVMGLAEHMTPKGVTAEDTKNPFSPETTLKMRNLALKDTFANMYLDDKFLLQYPPETVLDAYNKVMQLHPEIAARQNADALVTSLVKRVITSNNEIDPLEIPAAMTAGKALADIRFREDTRPWD